MVVRANGVRRYNRALWRKEKKTMPGEAHDFEMVGRKKRQRSNIK